MAKYRFIMSVDKNCLRHYRFSYFSFKPRSIQTSVDLFYYSTRSTHTAILRPSQLREKTLKPCYILHWILVGLQLCYFILPTRSWCVRCRVDVEGVLLHSEGTNGVPPALTLANPVSTRVLHLLLHQWVAVMRVPSIAVPSFHNLEVLPTGFFVHKF